MFQNQPPTLRADAPPLIVLSGDTARTRLQDPVTSHRAADSNGTRTAVERLVFRLLAERPMTDVELTEKYFSTPGAPETHADSPRKRRSDLTNRGVVIDTHRTRPTAGGRHATVWATTTNDRSSTMMTTEVDLGGRCDRHVGEVFPPRCGDCDALHHERATVPAAGFIPGSECITHRGYPLPCARCARELEDAR